MTEDTALAAEQHIKKLFGRELTDKEKLILRMGISVGLRSLEDRLLELSKSEIQHSTAAVGTTFSSPEDYFAGITTGLIMAREASVRLR